MNPPPLLRTVDRSAGSVHLERTLPAPPGDVWDALTDPARLGAWLAPVDRAAPSDGEFVLRMNAEETATCTVTTWDPPRELTVTWDYRGEGPSRLRFRLADTDGRTLITVDHARIPRDPVRYGAGWHVHLDHLAAHLSGALGIATGCDNDDFLAANRALEPRYAGAARDA
jgi:uncharacterized protein YndB with AHSA1/START domain